MRAGVLPALSGGSKISGSAGYLSDSHRLSLRGEPLSAGDHAADACSAVSGAIGLWGLPKEQIQQRNEYCSVKPMNTFPVRRSQKTSTSAARAIRLMRITSVCVWTQLPTGPDAAAGHARRCPGGHRRSTMKWASREAVSAIPAPSITTSVDGPMRTRSAGSLRRTPILRARHPFTQCCRLLNWDT